MVTSCEQSNFEIMKKNINKYENVSSLPPNAVTVKQYADSREVSTTYIYKLIREGKADFKMVVFQTINFIIP